MVRYIKAPASIPAVLPHGPMQQPPEPTDDLKTLYESIDEEFAQLAADTTRVLQQLQGTLTPDARKPTSATAWGEGVKFGWKNVADPAASDLARSTPLSRAWRNTAAWLRVVRDNRTEHLVKAATWKLLFYDHRLKCDDPWMQTEAAEFISWKRCLSTTTLEHPTWT